MFTTGSLGDYLGVPTRKSYYASSVYATKSIAACSESASIAFINSNYSWDKIISNLGFNKTLSQITGVTCSRTCGDSGTVLLRIESPLQVQRYTNANMTFDVINNVNRTNISHGLLVGITPGNTVVRTWNFDIPVNAKDATVTINIPLGNMINVFDNQGSDQDGIDFFILLPSEDMPKDPTLAVTSLKVFDTPQDSEITFNDFPFKSQKSGSDSYPRLPAYRDW